MTGPSFTERAAAARAGDLSLLTTEERASVVAGRGLGRPRMTLVRPAHTNAGRTDLGLSREAIHLFSAAQAKGGTIELAELKQWARPVDQEPLVAELVTAGLAERVVLPPSRLRALEEDLLGTVRAQQQRVAIKILPEFVDAIVAPHGAGWSRWH
jgi:hypothetical protein